jgi:hypothetical protein
MIAWGAKYSLTSASQYANDSLCNICLRTTKIERERVITNSLIITRKNPTEL